MKLNSGATLKALMEQKGFTHEQMARYAGCSRGFISHLTKGRKTSCTDRIAENLAEALDAPLEILFVANVPPAGLKNVTRKGKAA